MCKYSKNIYVCFMKVLGKILGTNSHSDDKVICCIISTYSCCFFIVTTWLQLELEAQPFLVQGASLECIIREDFKLNVLRL